MIGRLPRLGLLLVALWVGHVVTSELDVNEVNTDPFVRTGQVGRTVHLSYADVEVTDVRPAKYVAPTDETQLARMAGGVYVLVSATVTQTRATDAMRAVYLVDDRDRQYRTSAKAGCASGVTGKAALPMHALFCFDVPVDALPGLRFRIARGSEIYDSTRGDDLAEVDLGVSQKDADSWAQTEDAYVQEVYEDQPFELKQVTLTQVDE